MHNIFRVELQIYFDSFGVDNSHFWVWLGRHHNVAQFCYVLRIFHHEKEIGMEKSTRVPQFTESFEDVV